MAKRLSETGIKNMRPPATGRVEFNDAIQPGLRFRITDKGVKTFSTVTRIRGQGHEEGRRSTSTGKPRRITLGRWPQMSLVEARAKASEILSKARAGEDPRGDRDDGTSFAEAIDRWFAAELKGRLRSADEIHRAVKRHAVEAWGRRPIETITKEDVHALLDTLVAEGLIGAARGLRRHLVTFFGWAVERGLIETSPAARLKRRDLAPNKNAGRSLTNDEIKRLWKATGDDGLGYPFGALIRSLLLTGQRRSEWGNASWPEIDLGKARLEIPAARYKTGRDHIVPLAPRVVEIVEALPRWETTDDDPDPSGEFLFSGRRGVTPCSGWSKAKSKLDELTGDAGAYRLHDLRVTCETRLAEFGHSREVRDAVLGHAQQGVSALYNKYDFLAEKTAALTEYSEHILEIANG